MMQAVSTEAGADGARACKAASGSCFRSSSAEVESCISMLCSASYLRDCTVEIWALQISGSCLMTKPCRSQCVLSPDDVSLFSCAPLRNRREMVQDGTGQAHDLPSHLPKHAEGRLASLVTSCGPRAKPIFSCPLGPQAMYMYLVPRAVSIDCAPAFKVSSCTRVHS